MSLFIMKAVYKNLFSTVWFIICCTKFVFIHVVFGSRLELPWWIRTTSWWSCWAVLSSIISSAQQTAESDTAERMLTRSALLPNHCLSSFLFFFSWFLSACTHFCCLWCLFLSAAQDVVQQNNTLIEEMLHLVIMIVGEWLFLNTFLLNVGI